MTAGPCQPQHQGSRDV